VTPNALAWAALGAWPAVVLIAFAARRSSSRVARTTAWMMVLPVMFLPANLDLPFAGLNKQRISMLSVAMALALFHHREIAWKERWRHFPFLALIVFGLGSLGTMLTNADALTFGILRLPGLGPRDAAWLTYGFAVDLCIPFAIGQRVFRNERDLRDLLEVLSSCALIYLPLCLIEMRLSPQLSNWVYGYFPHSFLQTMRGSGYRPVVFMSHGLSVAMFLFSGACAALALYRVRAPVRPPPGVRVLLIAAMLVLSRNLASIIYAITAFFLIALPSSRGRAWAVASLAIILGAYPILRTYDIIPTTEIADAFKGISEDRSGSLMFRFNEEDKLLEKAVQRPLFGWGNWARNRIFLAWGERGDPWAGYKDLSITDGMWIIWLGTSGILGLSVSYALLLVPLLRFARRRPVAPSSQVLVGALAVIVGLFAADLLPNSQSDTLPVAYAGALFGLTAVRSRPRARAGAFPAHGEPSGRSHPHEVGYARPPAGNAEVPR
jgi:hypothetical protein